MSDFDFQEDVRRRITAELEAISEEHGKTPADVLIEAAAILRGERAQLGENSDAI